MQNGCNYSAGACYSPTGSDKIWVINFSFHQCAFACARKSRWLCYSSHSCQGNSPWLACLNLSLPLYPSFVLSLLSSLPFPSLPTILSVVDVVTVTIMVTVTWCSRQAATEPSGSAVWYYIKYWANFSPYNSSIAVIIQTPHKPWNTQRTNIMRR
jgi:hypothetical protein